MAGVGVMSVEEYGNSTTLVFAAQRIFPTWLFYFFIDVYKRQNIYSTGYRRSGSASYMVGR